jgi:hypothetical protein
MHSIQTHTEKGHGHETQRPAAATPDKGTSAPSLGVRELNHGHFVILTWFWVSHCVTQVGDYGPLHGAARGPLTRGVGPRNIDSLKSGQILLGSKF